MRAHGRQHRRHRGNKAQDDEPLLVSREETRAESYPRSHQNTRHIDNFRTHSTGRNSYEMNRESSSSQNHHDSDSWRRNDTYSYHDNYRRGRRDEYEGVETRESEGWAPRRNSDTHYTPREEWPPRYEPASYSSSYQEQSSWNPPTSSSYSRWPEDDRDTHPDSRNNDLALQHQQSRRPSRDRWQRDQRQNRESQNYKADADMGMEPQYNDSGGGKTWDEESGWDNRRMPSPSTDRQWEPAASWKSSVPDDSENQRMYNQNGHRQTTLNKNSRNNRRHPNRSGNSRRDWRNDDGDLNNWSKRDHIVSDRLERPERRNKLFTSRRRHRRSVSPSGSRSPTGSYYSHYSSRGRSPSRSISPAPKRRKRELSLNTRSPSPEDRDRGRGGWLTNDKTQSTSPTSHRNRDGWENRRRSISSVSSVASDRSRSRSPADRPRAVHRLPSGPTPASEVLISQRTKVAQDTSGQRTGKTSKKKGKSSRKTALTQAYSVEQMPPPISVPSIPKPVSRRNQPHLTGLSPSPPHLQIDPALADMVSIENNSPSVSNALPPRPASSLPPRPLVDHPAKRPLIDAKGGVSTPIPTSLSIKSAGFKPIGRGISSLEHFFPGDDATPNTPSAQAPNRMSEDSQVAQNSWDAVIHGSAESSVHDRQSQNLQLNTPQFVASSNAHPLSPKRGRRSSSDHDAHGRRSSEVTPANRLQDSSEAGGMDAHPVPIHSNDSPTELYTIVSQVGEGTFGKVYKARNTVTNVHVALKRIRMESERDGFPVTAMREIKLLQSLRHSNVVRLYEMMVSNGSVYMVFEYMDHDLTGILSQTQFQFSNAHLKSLCHQMLNGLAYLHHKGVVHRDIKGSNILINNRGELKLGDFGLARFYQKRRRTDYTNRVITLWYRPPELLFGATIYGPEVDMWSAGCIMLELFTKKPVFQGNDEISQLDTIYRIIGTPTLERWSGIANLPWYELVKPKESVPNHFRDLFRKWMSSAALDLAEQLLDYDPTKRATAVQAMNASYFTVEEPKAERPIGLSTLEGEWHELETKRERAKKRKKE